MKNQKKLDSIIRRIKKANASFGCMGAMLLEIELQHNTSIAELMYLRSVCEAKGISTKLFPTLNKDFTKDCALDPVAV